MIEAYSVAAVRKNDMDVLCKSFSGHYVWPKQRTAM